HMRRRYLLTPHITCAVLVIGCGQPPAPPSQPRLTAEQPSLTADSQRPGTDAERARAIREAEDFLRAQGYTDAPPSASGDAVGREGLEGTVADRRGMPEPRAVRACASGGEWVVVFRYQDSQLAGRGRALRLRAGQPPSFVRRDMAREKGSQ